MSDIMLTAGMRSNLMSLQQTSVLTARTQNRLSTGKSVNSSVDDPSKYFEALSLNQRSDGLTSLKSAMGDAIQVVKAASAGVDSALKILTQMRGLIDQANGTQVTATLTSLSAQFTALNTQLGQVAGDSGYNGTNLLGATNNSLTVNFNESGSSFATITGADATAGGAYGAAVPTNAWAGAGDISASLALVNTAISSFRGLATNFSSNLALVNTRQDFASTMSSVLSQGADNLTSADMNEEGANMLMLQTRQQLGTTALSMSAQAASAVMKLFG